MARLPHDRQNALLTTSQRKFLAGEDSVDFNSSHGRTVRTRIRRRVRSGLFDFELLLLNLPEDDLERVFAPAPRDEKMVEGNIVGATTDTVAFSLLGHTSQNPHPPAGQATIGSFEGVVAQAVMRATARRGEVVDSFPEVTIAADIEGDTDELELAELSLPALKNLLDAGEITPEEYADAVKAQSDDE